MVDIVFVVAITGIDNVGKGLIRDETGFVTFQSSTNVLYSG